MRFASLITLGLLATGCCCKSDEMTRFHEDGRAKPAVVIAPMIDTSSFDVPWSLSDELTSGVVERFSKSGRIYVVKNDDIYFTDNPFTTDLTWMKREFPNQEFVVFLELVEHEMVSADKSKKDLPPQEVSTNLNMAVRLRVVDLRSHLPKIVLQETVRDTYFIPKTLLPTNYNAITWGTPEYEESHMKVAHDLLVNEISTRVADYILLAKSR